MQEGCDCRCTRSIRELEEIISCRRREQTALYYDLVIQKPQGGRGVSPYMIFRSVSDSISKRIKPTKPNGLP